MTIRVGIVLKFKQKENNVDKFLKENSKKTPNEPINVAGYETLSDSVRLKYEEYKRHENDFRVVESELLSISNDIYSKNALNDHHCKSLKFAGESTDGVIVSYPDKFKDVSIDSKEVLEKSLGDKFKQVFEVKRTLTLRKTDDKSIEMLINAVGRETFLELFEIKTSLAVKKDVDRVQYGLPSNVKSVLEQTKASVKPL